MKEFMTHNELYEQSASDSDKKLAIINYARYLYSIYNRPLLKVDFSISNRISHAIIYKLFGGIANLCLAANIPSKRRPQKLQIKDFFLSIKKESENGCWIQSFYSEDLLTPYSPKIKYKGKNIRLHRVSYIEFKGQIPEKYVVKHICNNPKCFNPDHLEVDTHQGNIIDASNDGLLGKPHKVKTKGTVKDPYNYEELLTFVKLNIQINNLNEWLYQGSISQTGYPIRTINDKNYYLHKLIVANKYNKHYDEIEVARHILPNGDKPSKHNLNPEHLFIGSNYDNWEDSLTYKTDIKLSYEIANRIRQEASITDFSIRGSKKSFDLKWANILNVSESTISKIRLNQTWTKREV